MELTKHIVVDTNTLLAYLHPGSTDDETLKERSRILFDAAVNAKWPAIRLYMPAICVAEAFVNLDKFFWYTWGKPLSLDSSKTLSPKKFKNACDILGKLVEDRVIEQLEHEPVHAKMARLVSPVNFHFRLNEKALGFHKKPPMNTSDCIIGGMAIHLAHRLGCESVVLVTNDYRLADVIAKSQQLSKDEKEKVKATQRAKQVGLKWSHELFPECIILSQVSERKLKETLGGWPLPTTPLNSLKGSLKKAHEELLFRIWVSSSTYWGIKDPDKLPYSKALKDIKTQLAFETSIYLEDLQVFKLLVNMRKSGKFAKYKDTLAGRRQKQKEQKIAAR